MKLARKKTMAGAVPAAKYFLPYQAKWIEDKSPLKIMEKSRQVGMSYATAYSAVERAAARDARLDVWVSSRDETQAKLFLEDCQGWAGILKRAAVQIGQAVFENHKDFTAHVLEFVNGRKIYSLSSNPNALAGKRGHVILDEFALHQDQRELYRIAKPVTTWGGQLEIISTHRGANTVFNEILRDIKEHGNPMGWSHHRVPLQAAIDQGLVEKINGKTGRNESRSDYAARIRAECLDEEQWQQEYCCTPADDSTAFLTYEMISACETAQPLLTFSELSSLPPSTLLYIGVDIGRKNDLTVIDVGEKIGDVTHDRMRLELQNKTFAEQEFELYRLLALPQVKRACIDATGLGMQLAERARERFGWKVEAVTFTGPVKEELAFPLRAAFEDRMLRIDKNAALRADLRGIKKEATTAGNIRFAGEAADSHCDRFWALALRQHAAAVPRGGVGAMVG
jgi:phage FluMu gp28-like protein